MLFEFHSPARALFFPHQRHLLTIISHVTKCVQSLGQLSTLPLAPALTSCVSNHLQPTDQSPISN
jgi:hypothetical protein